MVDTADRKKSFNKQIDNLYRDIKNDSVYHEDIEELRKLHFGVIDEYASYQKANDAEAFNRYKKAANVYALLIGTIQSEPALSHQWEELLMTMKLCCPGIEDEFAKLER